MVSHDCRQQHIGGQEISRTVKMVDNIISDLRIMGYEYDLAVMTNTNK